MSCIIPPCAYCEHCYVKDGNIVCSAFPEGIPKEYYWCKIDVEALDECANGYKFKDKHKNEI